MKPGQLTILGVIFFAALGMAPACPGPQPLPTPGTGGSPGTGGAPDTGGAPGTGGTTPVGCKSPGSFCCKECDVLIAHDCHLEADPTPNGAGCEERCNVALKSPVALKWPDVTTCTTLACVHAPKAGVVGIACSGGK
jgi:hypothetical protein